MNGLTLWLKLRVLTLHPCARKRERKPIYSFYLHCIPRCQTWQIIGCRKFRRSLIYLWRRLFKVCKSTFNLTSLILVLVLDLELLLPH